MTIYTRETTPYFYIIRHISTGMMYAGSKYAKGCNPDYFMTACGYTTSSNTINDIISKEGIQSFEILRIDTYCDGFHPYDYETTFLKTNNCASSDNWYNGHNNTGMSFGLLSFYKKSKSTLMHNHGVDHPSKIPEHSSKVKQTKLDRYGDEHYNNLPKSIETCKTKYDVKTYFESGDYRIKMDAYFDLHNITNVSQLPDHRDKTIETCIAKYNDPNYNNRSLASITTLERYGVDNYNKLPEARKKASENMKAARSKDLTYTCVNCATVIKGKGNYVRWHGDNCKMKC